MEKTEMMQAMSMHELCTVNGGSINPPSLVLLIYNVLNGVFAPIV